MTTHMVYRDETPLTGPMTENECWTWIHKHQGMSVDWAIQHEGYSIRDRQMVETEHFLGRDDDGTRYFATIRLHADNTDREVEFTNHTTGILKYRLSVSGFAIEKGRREAHSAGQMCEDFTLVTTPAEGWTLDDIASLVAIWREWHLNDMNAWSDEQRDRAISVKFDYETLRGLTDSSGYTYGTKWLARQLPDDAVVEIARLKSLPYGNIPSNY